MIVADWVKSQRHASVPAVIRHLIDANEVMTNLISRGGQSLVRAMERQAATDSTGVIGTENASINIPDLHEVTISDEEAK